MMEPVVRFVINWLVVPAGIYCMSMIVHSLMFDLDFRAGEQEPQDQGGDAND